MAVKQGKSTSLAKLFMEAEFTGTTFTLPTLGLWVALFESEPNRAMSAAELEAIELNYTTYARIKVAFAGWEFKAGGSEAADKVANTSIITFATPSVVAATRHTAKWFGAMRTVTGGTSDYTGKLATEQVANVGGAVEIAAKAVEFTEE